MDELNRRAIVQPKKPWYTVIILLKETLHPKAEVDRAVRLSGLEKLMDECGDCKSKFEEKKKWTIQLRI